MMDQYVFLYVGKGEGWTRFKIEVSKIGLHRYPLNGKYCYPCQQLPASWPSCPPQPGSESSPVWFPFPCTLSAPYPCLLHTCPEPPSTPLPHLFPCSLSWEVLAFLPRSVLGLRAQALQTNTSAPCTLCIAKCLIAFNQTAKQVREQRDFHSNMKTKNFQNIHRIFGGRGGAVIRSQV